MIKLKSRIDHWIDQRGLKNKFISTKLKVSPEQVSKWRNGKAFPRVDKLFELAILLQVKVDDLYEVIDISGTVENEE
ncbi:MULTISPECIES: helix-turn-helix domain-containing protein [Bacillaceae]|uniref:Helix-turn-helix domain-containing protein n=1 Tax=Evansella alkalicola TaxID=745819 RepID=A0ABS6K243_9BACI|nr:MULTISPECIES: helix-turn-helix transcriptional regulator [Bacillaceae]MBU9724109.1 helix-turn-helix domain-containing protein [Bacillus alkalicola]